ncbi:LysR family transcriptional regulator [Herbiconiux liukaitaii]|uniref:LysR family transcriptional regulator n=1 Tax=Herbiconiux liukaitaii TaxID=3342799 RepID=UPI0035B9A341
MQLTNLNLRQLEYFVAIAEAGSITLAAAHLHVSQSAVAAALTSLERALDVQLCIRRRSHGITLTSSGRLLRDRARALLHETAGIEQEVSGRTAPLTGTVVVGCAEESAPMILPPILQGLRHAHPDLAVEVEIALEESFWPRVESGEVDLAVSLDHRLPAELSRVRLRAMPVLVVLPHGHPLAAQERVQMADLAHEDYIMLTTEPGATHAYSMFNRAGVLPRIAFRSPTFELARALVGRGLGYTIHVQRPAGDVTYEGLPLEVRPLVTGLPVEYVAMAWSARVRPSPRVQAVIDAALRAWPDAGEAPGEPLSAG